MSAPAHGAEYFCRSRISRFVPCPFRSSSAQEKAPVRIDFRRSLGYTNHVGSLNHAQCGVWQSRNPDNFWR